LIIDDGDGRNAGGQLGLKITGTIGVLLLASQEGMLDLKSTLDELKAASFRLSDREYEKILFLHKSSPNQMAGPARAWPVRMPPAQTGILKNAKR
jgi:hypothetical protein